MSLLKNITACFFAAILFTACSGGAASIKDKLGVETGSPDEFRVVRRAPLEIPDDLVLRSPTPGADRPQEFTPLKQAKKALIKSDPSTEQAPVTTTTNDTQSAGTTALLTEVGADKVPSDIRQTIDAETKKWNARNTPVIERIGLVKKGEASGIRLDPTAEAIRLLKEQDAGRVVRPFGLDTTNQGSGNQTATDAE